MFKFLIVSLAVALTTSAVALAVLLAVTSPSPVLATDSADSPPSSTAQELPDSDSVIGPTGSNSAYSLWPATPGAEGAVRSRSITFLSNGRQVRLTENQAGRHLLVTEKSGQVTFDGPINTPEQRAAVPADILQMKIISRHPAALHPTPADQPPAAAGPVAPTSMRSTSFHDGQHHITLKIRDESRHLLARDNERNVLFNGPIDTPEQRAAVPEDILRKVQSMKTYIQHLPPNVSPKKSGATPAQ